MEDQQINLLKPQLSQPTPSPKKPIWVLFFVCAAAILGLIFLKNYSDAKKMATQYDQEALEPKKIGFLQSVKNFIFHGDVVMIGQADDRINILLLGIGGEGHDGPYLSDTNIILSIKPSTKQIAMISVPRDLAAKINNYGYRKINNANAFGEMEQSGNGGEYARHIFEDTFNIDIPYYARVDFTAFKEIIDNVGGITVDVERSFTDYSYPGPNDSYQTISFEAGQQELNGERALIFSRSRHGNNGEGSDFARAKRQQIMLSALKKKMLSSSTYLNPLTLQKIISSLSRHIVTNLDLSQIAFLANLGKDIDSDNIRHLVLDDSPTGFLKPITGENGAYLLAPKSGTFNDISIAINTIFDTTSTIAHTAPVPKIISTTPSITIPAARIEIQNGTWRAGLAALKKQELETEKLFVSTIKNSAQRPISSTVIYVLNKNTPEKTVQAIIKKIGAPTSYTLPEWLNIAYNENASSTKPDILIVLGEDTQ